MLTGIFVHYKLNSRKGHGYIDPDTNNSDG